MKNISEKSFGVNLIIMNILNMYPPDKQTIFFKIKAYLLFFVLIPPVPVLGILYFLFENNFTVAHIDDNAFLIAEMACQVTKFLPFITNGARIKRCIRFFDSPRFSVHKEKHQKMMDECCWICKRNSMVFLVGIVAGIIFFAVKPLFYNDQKLPADLWLPFDPRENSETFICVYFFIVIGVAYASFACAAIDPLIGGLLYLATGQFQLLKDNLQHLNEYATHKSKDSKKNLVNEIIKECVDRHNAILEFICEYEACFSVSVFSQIMGTTLVICFCCLKLSHLNPMTFDFISMITFFSIILGQIYVYCYYGTLLFEESNSLTYAIYMGTWYELSIESKTSLMVLMERSQRPIIITAGKILELSVETFTTILRRSYSLLAVLKNF